MILKYQHNFEGNSDYELPYVLVYRGTEDELINLRRWAHIQWPDLFKAGIAFGLELQVDLVHWTQSIHFKHKNKCALCKLTWV